MVQSRYGDANLEKHLVSGDALDGHDEQRGQIQNVVRVFLFLQGGAWCEKGWAALMVPHDQSMERTFRNSANDDFSESLSTRAVTLWKLEQYSLYRRSHGI
jgi:hypothetical protein